MNPTCSTLLVADIFGVRPQEINPKVSEVLDLYTLSLRERTVLAIRYGLDSGKPKTLRDTGAAFGVTTERIRQIEAKALRKLRHPSRSKALEVFVEEKKEWLHGPYWGGPHVNYGRLMKQKGEVEA